MKRLGLIVAMLALCTGAWAQQDMYTTNYTDQQQEKWAGMWRSVGGFIYNVAPWNWDNWLWGGKKQS